MPRYSAVKREEIRNAVHDLVLLHARPIDILRYLSEKMDVNITRRQLEFYMAEVKEDFKAASRFKRDEELGQAISRLKKQYRKADKANDIRAAIAAQREISETLGLKAPAKLEHEAGETLHDWLKQAATTWPAEGDPPNGGKSSSGPDPSTVSETHNC